MWFENQHNSHCVNLKKVRRLSFAWQFRYHDLIAKVGGPQNSWNSIQIWWTIHGYCFLFSQKIHSNKNFADFTEGNLRQKVLQILLWRGKDGGPGSISKLHHEKGACVALHRLLALGGGKYHFEPSSELARDTKFTVQWCLSCEIKQALLDISVQDITVQVWFSIECFKLSTLSERIFKELRRCGVLWQNS